MSQEAGCEPRTAGRGDAPCGMQHASAACRSGRSTWNISLKGCGSVMSLPVSGAFTAHDFSAAPSCAWSSSPTVASVVRASCLR